MRTLGDVLKYAQTPTAGGDWTGLVRAIADGDRDSLLALYDRSHRAVFTLLRRRTANVRIAEELTIDVYVDVWNGARTYGGTATSTLAWIMNIARRRVKERLRFARRPPAHDRDVVALLSRDLPDPRDVADGRQAATAIAAAIACLRPEERAAIEGTFFAGRSYVEHADALRESPEIVLRQLATALGRLSGRATDPCPEAPLAAGHSVDALPAPEMQAIDSHLQSCSACREHLAALRELVRRFAWWPTDLLRPCGTVRKRVGMRIAAESEDGPRSPDQPAWPEPDWMAVAPGISVKMLEADSKTDTLSMLVRLARDGQYPSHTHAGIEELHLLDGELWIDYCKLYPGDYRRAEAGTLDTRVWSETGCMCVLVTRAGDLLG